MSYKSAKNKLDKIFAEYIRCRDGRCVVCGSVNHLQCGHYLGRRKLSTRWDEENCNCQCAGCNMKHNENAVPYTKIMIQKYGKAIVEKLDAKYNENIKYKEYQLQEMIDLYKNKIKNLKE